MNTLHDIFSKKPTKSSLPTCPNPKIPIVIDTREKQSFIAAQLASKKASIVFEKLDIGDYKVADKVIERKTVADFISSMISRRLFDQLSNLKKYEHHALLIEGELKVPSHSKMSPNALKGMLLSIALDFQVPLILTQDESDTADHLILLAKREEKQKGKPAAAPSKTAKTLREQKLLILQSFPGIGPSIAEELLQTFGSLQSVFKAKKSDLQKISKFHDKKIVGFLKLLS